MKYGMGKYVGEEIRTARTLGELLPILKDWEIAVGNIKNQMVEQFRSTYRDITEQEQERMGRTGKNWKFQKSSNQRYIKLRFHPCLVSIGRAIKAVEELSEKDVPVDCEAHGKDILQYIRDAVYDAWYAMSLKESMKEAW